MRTSTTENTSPTPDARPRARRVLVTWGSRRGGTEGIGHVVAEELTHQGLDVLAVPAARAPRPDGFDAVIIGGALYANTWPPDVRRFVHRNVDRLRRVPVWLFSSGPLDTSADRAPLPPSDQVAVLAERVGARAHVTFGGRLERDARGFIASKMAREHVGDWRNPARIRAWAAERAAELPHAVPGAAVEHPARSLPRLLGHGLLGWVACATALAGLLAVLGRTPALVLHALLVPAVFAAVARHYFRARGAREPLPTALAWTLLALLVLPWGVGLAVFSSVLGTWVPLALAFGTTWGVGALVSTLPWDRPDAAQLPGPGAQGHAR